MTSGENCKQMTFKYCSWLKLALLLFRTWNTMAYHIRNVLHIITAGKRWIMINRISHTSHGYDFSVANHETATVLFAGAASNEIKVTVHSVDFFRSYFTKRYNGRTSWFLTVLPQSFSHLGVPVSSNLTIICWRCSLEEWICSCVKNLPCLYPLLRVLSYLPCSHGWSGLCLQELYTYKSKEMYQNWRLGGHMWQ